MVPLTPEDAEELQDLDASIEQTARDLARVRERERRLVIQLQQLRNEYTALMEILGPRYLAGQPAGEWTFRPDNSAFVLMDQQET